MKIIFKSILMLSFIFTGQFVLSQSDINSEMVEEQKVEKDSDEVPEIFKNHEWLSKIVDHENCKGAQIFVKSTGHAQAHKYLIVDIDGARKMYNSEGVVWCTSSNSINCEKEYKLTKLEDEWICE